MAYAGCQSDRVARASNLRWVMLVVWDARISSCATLSRDMCIYVQRAKSLQCCTMVGVHVELANTPTHMALVVFLLYFQHCVRSALAGGALFSVEVFRLSMSKCLGLSIRVDWIIDSFMVYSRTT